MIRALFKFAKLPELVEGKKPVVIDTTSNSGDFRELSPFELRVPLVQWGSVIFENLWQFSKVYKQHVGDNGLPTTAWLNWREWGFAETRAHRYPMGKGAIPEYSYWNGEKLDYIQARKKIYAPEYAKNVINTESYNKLGNLYSIGHDIILLDYDAYDHIKLGMSLQDVINNPNRKMGHAFVLIMMLTGLLEECINS